MAVRSVPRWLIIGLIVSAAGVCCLGVERIRSRRSVEPNALPRSVAEAQPLATAELRRLPLPDEQYPASAIPANLSGDRDSDLQVVAHDAALAALPLMIAAAPQSPDGKMIAFLTEDALALPLRWDFTQDSQEVRLRTREVTLHFAGTTAAPTEVRLKDKNGGFVDASGGPRLIPADGTDATRLATTAGASPTTSYLKITLPDVGVQTITVSLAPTPYANTGASLGTIRFLVAEPGGNTPPAVTDAFNNPFAKDRGFKVSDLTSENSVRIYGSYIRLQGTCTKLPSELRCMLFKRTKNDGNVFLGEIIPDSARIPANGNWISAVTLPKETVSAGFQGWLVTYVVSGDKFIFAEKHVPYTIQANDVFIGPPSITSLTYATMPDSTKPVQFDDASSAVSKSQAFNLKGSAAGLGNENERQDGRVLLYKLTSSGRILAGQSAFKIASDLSWPDSDPATAPPTPLITEPADGEYQYVAEVVHGSLTSPTSKPVTVQVRTRGPRIVNTDPPNMLFGPGRIQITLFFSRENPLKPLQFETGTATTWFRLLTPDGKTVVPNAESPLTVAFDPTQNSVTVTFADIQTEGSLLLQIGTITKDTTTIKDPLQDVYGLSLDNKLSTVPLTRSVLAATPSVAPGISHTTGDYVPFPEFTKPRDVPDGFNPNDKVETRVARLYYYRDAHRVAQLINRKVKSYNRQGVDMQRQLADKARNDAEQKTIARQQAERAAIMKSQKTREKERALQVAEQSANTAMQELTNYRRANPTADPAIDPQIKALDSAVRSFTAKSQDLRADVQALRDQEVAANELTQQAEAQEKLAAQEQFRREVAAAHEDPDTYVPGVINSNDPVEQVSVSVIGEGLIQLRGPLKGVNVIRTMIDQIDTPVGQVRISVHSVQINGEKADRMEVVAKHIQTYIDQARFLTMQSSEMLRKAVVQVASQKAEEARGLFPGDTQEDRDQRYLYGFFGKDFIDELRAMDSEFLNSGNKLLSLHSMDTTSLSSALNLMALAKNSTRREIFDRFEAMLQGELCQAEMNYLAAGVACKTKHFPLACRDPKYCAMAGNAKFESLKGFFNAEIGHDDTITPLQREFLRLAQIFKSRLVTELEYKQRVMERALIEERLGDRLGELRDAREKERIAKEAFAQARSSRRAEIASAQTQLELAFAEIAALVNDSNTLRGELAWMRPAAKLIKDKKEYGVVPLGEARISFKYHSNEPLKLAVVDEQGGEIGGQEAAEEIGARAFWRAQVTVDGVFQKLRAFKFQRSLNDFRLANQYQQELNGLRDVAKGSKVKQQRVEFEERNLQKVVDYKECVERLLSSVTKTAQELKQRAELLLVDIRSPDANLRQVSKNWVQLRFDIEDSLWKPTAERTQLLSKVDKVFETLLDSESKLSLAREEAELSRRPLDHKKLLDMLIDDLEEKYIELLDGTRAHTANVDNYLKRLTTALDDDFNTQFYFPTFRQVREASQFYDVQFGQTETTSILANNRDFAKVSPSASMEFDLPKRDILLTEGLNGAKAMMNDFGALANDPTFLAMAKMKSGQSGATPTAGSAGGFGMVRDVLPGLSTSTSEQMMSQNANGGQQFGSNLENLIPDPAVYKFETGTGFEIRPVVQPDGQAVVFRFNYMYSTNIREPVRADEKHLGRIKRHYIDTDVQLSNFELREVSRYTVALKAARTSRGVPGLEDVPLVGVLFRPLPSAEASLQQSLIMAQATIFPTLFDLMGLRWAPAVSDLDPLRVSNTEFVIRNRNRVLKNRVYDEASSYVDSFLRIPEAERRTDLYRSQETVPAQHPNGYQGPGLNQRDSQLQEGHQPNRARPQERFIPGQSREGAPFNPGRGYGVPQGTRVENYPLEPVAPGNPYPEPIVEPNQGGWQGNR
ncbi:MAG: hypothetical protein NTY19_06400 [Planctomycetota bacterium]|nr:hypothetical protein [Planctomycetota bacterium]